MNSPIVWICKEQMRRTDVGSEPMDYSPAMAYGEIRFITHYDMPTYPSGHIRMRWDEDVREFVKEYNEDRDFIIATGQPTAILAIGHALGVARKIPRYLVWRREDNRYRVLETLPPLVDSCL